MKAAIIQAAGQPPMLEDVTEPVPSPGEKLVTVTASAVSHLAKTRASGAHYSSTNQFPFVVGIDGVGRLDDGTRVYFALPEPPNGSMAERTVVSSARCVPLPETLDDLTAAAVANPGMSCWAAFKERAKLQAGETVLINGATGTAGRLAVQIAKHLGAKKIIATGRNPDTLRLLSTLGADVTIPLVEDKTALETSLTGQFKTGIDVIIDYLWGTSAESLLIARAKVGGKAGPTRFVQIGAASGSEMTLPAAVLRSSAIDLMGSGLGSVSFDGLIRCVGELLQATVPGGFKIDFKPVPLAEFDEAWPKDDSTRRTVFTVAARRG